MSAGADAVSDQAIKNIQLELLAAAEASCHAAVGQLRQLAVPVGTSNSPGQSVDGEASLLPELTGLSDNLAGLRKLVETQEV